MKESLITFIEGCEKEQFGLLEELVLQQSSSCNKAGVDAVGKRIAASLQETGMALEVVPEQEVGDQLIFRSPGYRAGCRSLLLVGHMDTVYPADSAFNWYREDEGKVFGPGVIDMKGGACNRHFCYQGLGPLRFAG